MFLAGCPRRGSRAIARALAVAALLSAPLAYAERPFAVLHTAVTEATEGKEIELNANVQRYREVAELLARYRARGGSGFRTVTLRRSQGDFFEGKIPAKDVRAPALEYFLLIRDREGKARNVFASPSSPQVIKVLAKTATTSGRTALEEEFAVLTGEEEVVSAARVRQRIEESPSAITVITAEDIKNYGATSIAEVLRTVPGLDYIQISGADPNVTARGFNRELSARMLTLIDGRSAYVDIFGNTFWEVMPISVWDIDRIEVIRGPGSTLYGANAFGGVINIFTKKPKDAEGLHFYTQGGGSGFNSTLMTAGKANSYTSYRMSTTFDQLASFDRITTEEKIGVRGNAQIHWDLPFGAGLELRGGMLRETVGPVMSLNGPFTTPVTMGYAQLNFDYKDLRLQTWYTGFKADILRSFPLPRYFQLTPTLRLPASSVFGNVQLANITNARPDTFDFEATYTKQPWKELRVVLGGNYRYNGYSLPSLLEQSNRQHTLGAFAQFEIRPISSLSINLGGRFDALTYADQVCPRDKLSACLAGDPTAPKVDVDPLINFAPRGSVVWGFAKDQFLRASGGIAFRNPSFVEKLIRFEVAPAGALPSGRTRPSINFAADSTLGSEQLRSAELGYGINLWGKRIRINLDLFYLEGLNLIQFQSGSLLAALTGLAPLSSVYRNLIDARNYGGEVSVKAQLSKELKAFVNYSWERVELKNKEDLLRRIGAGEFGPGATLSDITTIDSESPMHKLNFGINWSNANTGLFINLYGHFVSSTRRRNLFTALPGTPVNLALLSGGAIPGSTTLGALTGAKSIEDLDAYFTLNANIGYRLFNGQMEIGISGFNVLGDYGAQAYDALTGSLSSRRHLEYPVLSMQGQNFGGEAIGARVFGFIRGNFK